MQKKITLNKLYIYFECNHNKTKGYIRKHEKSWMANKELRGIQKKNSIFFMSNDVKNIHMT
jgi:hypothetical protein